MENYKVLQKSGRLKIGIDTNVIIDLAEDCRGMKITDFLSSYNGRHYYNQDNKKVLNYLLDKKLKFYVAPEVISELRGFADNKSRDNESSHKRKLAVQALRFLRNNQDYFRPLYAPQECALHLRDMANQLANVYCADGQRKFLNNIYENDELIDSQIIKSPGGVIPHNKRNEVNPDARIVARYALYGLDTYSYDSHLVGVIKGSSISRGSEIAKINEAILGEPLSTYDTKKLLELINIAVYSKRKPHEKVKTVMPKPLTAKNEAPAPTETKEPINQVSNYIEIKANIYLNNTKKEPLKPKIEPINLSEEIDERPEDPIQQNVFIKKLSGILDNIIKYSENKLQKDKISKMFSKQNDEPHQ